MSIVFFPNQPSPARRARSRSRIGPVSTYALPATRAPTMLVDSSVQQAQALEHHVVIVVAARVARDRTGRLASAVVQADDDRALAPCERQARVATLFRGARHVRHLARVAALEPFVERARRLGRPEPGVMPTRSKPSPYACALISDSIMAFARPTSRIARRRRRGGTADSSPYAVYMRQRTYVAVGQRQEWKSPVPVARAKPPADANQRHAGARMAESAPREAHRDRRPRPLAHAVEVHRANTVRAFTNERPSRIAGIGAPSAASALGITSTVRRGVSANGRFDEQRHQHVLAMQRAVRAHVRDRLVARAKIPVARRRENDLAGARRRREMRDLHDAVRIVGVDRRVVRVVADDARTDRGRCRADRRTRARSDSRSPSRHTTRRRASRCERRRRRRRGSEHRDRPTARASSASHNAASPRARARRRTHARPEVDDTGAPSRCRSPSPRPRRRASTTHGCDIVRWPDVLDDAGEILVLRHARVAVIAHDPQRHVVPAAVALGVVANPRRRRRRRCAARR